MRRAAHPLLLLLLAVGPGYATLAREPQPSASLNEAAARGEALRAAAAIIGVARKGRPPAGLDCSSFDTPGRPADEAACVARIAALRIESLTRAASCSDPAGPARCYVVGNDETELEIRFAPRSATPSGVAVYEVIIVTGTPFFGVWPG